MRVPEALGAMREREFRLFFAAQTVSAVGNAMAPIALAFAVLDLTGSASDVGFVLAAYAGSLVAFVLVGGVVGDRLARRRVMIVADLVCFGAQATAASLLLAGAAAVWHLAALQAVIGMATAFFVPSLTGLFPLTVSAARLQQANALRGLMLSGAEIAGPVLAGVLVVGVGSGWALAADAATFGVSAALLAGIRLPAHDRLRSRSFFADFRVGWAEFVSRTWVWTLVLWAALLNVLLASQLVLGPPVAKEDLGGAGAWSVIVAASGFGALLGGLAVLRFQPGRPLLVGVLATIPLGVPLLLLAIPASVATIAVANGLAGAGLMAFSTLFETSLQRHIPTWALSRVSSYDWFGSLALRPVGLAVVGPIAAVLGTSTTFYLAGSLVLAATVAVLTVPSVRQLPANGPPTDDVGNR